MIVVLGLFLVMTLLLIKYKPMYEVSIADETIGYVEDIDGINEYLYNTINQEDDKIAFVEIKNQPEMKLVFVNRNEADSLEELIKTIDKNTEIEYTAYAVTYNGKNKAYLSSMEEAEQVVSNIKQEYSEKDTKKLGILQVYSDEDNEFKTTGAKKATTKVSSAIKKEKKTEAIKIAKRNAIATINGIYFQTKPISGTVTSRFGGRRSPGGIGSTNHKGLDIAASSGTAIKAVAEGTVTWAGYKGSLGNLVIINHGNGVQTYYGHCSRIYVSKGQKVSAGKTISAVGQTGAATGPHLHLEIHINGTAVNPQKYMYR